MNKAIWIMGLIALAAVIFFFVRTVNNGKDQPSPPPPAPSAHPKEPQATVESIQCPECRGYGHVMQETAAGSKKVRCELCGGKGGKDLRIPPGYVICPDCQGFGKVKTARRYVMCRRCRQRGYIRQPFEPAE